LIEAESERLLDVSSQPWLRTLCAEEIVSLETARVLLSLVTPEEEKEQTDDLPLDINPINIPSRRLQPPYDPRKQHPVALGMITEYLAASIQLGQPLVLTEASRRRAGANG